MRVIKLLVYLALINATPLLAYVLEPIKESRDEISLIIVPGAQISPHKYIPIAKEIQKRASAKLWINIAEVPFNVANPFTIEKTVDDALKALKKSGAKARKLFVGGHSLGGAMIQYLKLEAYPIDGFIFMGSFISRNKRDDLDKVPCLTIAAELDGLTRVSRIAESYYKDIKSYKQQNAELKKPIYVIPGMNHSQFSSGHQPFLVRQRDLNAAIKIEDAHIKVGEAINDFFEYQISKSYESGQKLISKVKESGKKLKPFIDAMLLEGNYNFKPPCSQVDHSDCFKGSPWTSKMFLKFTGLPEQNIETEDEFRNVWRVFPSFQPKIEGACTQLDQGCLLKSKTVSQAIYENLDSLDTSFAPVSASEIRVKFKSRQSILEAVGQKNVDFNISDGYDACQVLNQHALDWALDAASAGALQRYYSQGVPMVIGPDLGPFNNGPQWIWTPLSTEWSKDSFVVRSPSLKTPLDYPIKQVSGFHHCKLLSPARALEWIYIDSMRDR